MCGYQGAGSRGSGVVTTQPSGVKEIVLLVVFLLIAAFTVDIVVGDSYWGNPAREEAEADQIRIENKGLEERQRIDREAYQQQKGNEVQALKEQAQQALLWRDRRHELGMVLATAIVAGLLIITGVRIAAPVAVHAYERYAYRRARLVEQQTRFEETQATRMREERQLLEEIRLQRAGATLAQEQDGGNGRGHSSHYAGISSTQRTNRVNGRTGMKLLYGATTRGGLRPAALRGYWADNPDWARTPVPCLGWASARGPPDKASALQAPVVGGWTG